MSNENDQYYKDGQSFSKEPFEHTDSSHKEREYRAGDNRTSTEDAQFTPIVDHSSDQQRPSGPTYYSYGNTRPMEAVQQPTNHQQAAAYPRSSETYEGSGIYGATSPQPNQSAYRPFTTSGGGDPLSAKKEKRSSGGFGKMFLSFMAGVVAVGLLMYTADVQNWFSKDVISTQNSYKSDVTNTGGSSSSSGTTNTATSLMMDRPDNIAELFNTASPAVVKIETFSKRSRSSSNSLFNDPFFRQFFGNNIPGTEDQNSNELEQSGMGTGFFFEADGYILTNQHVIADSDEIRVIVEGYDEPLVATLLGESYELDLAVLKVESDKSFPVLPLGNSENTKIGDWVIAIGNPYGFDHTLTVGVISAKERPIDIPDSNGVRNYEHLLQTDASINPGNSGGPLLNMNGEVIGINTAVSSTAQGIGFAIPTSTITEVLDALKNNEPIPEKPAPFIGVDLQDLTDGLIEQLELSSKEGTIVRNVYYNSPAYKGDLKQYDVITEVDGKKIRNTDELKQIIVSQEIGDVIELTVIRNGQTLQLPIEIGDKNEFGLE